MLDMIRFMFGIMPETGSIEYGNFSFAYMTNVLKALIHDVNRKKYFPVPGDCKFLRVNGSLSQ